ncbi:MAG: radical SAM protein [Desulfobacterales bacterium]|jgi:radical SAM superfamily enzyme YgiQ (UPF0313 family)
MKIELISPSLQGPRNLGADFHFPQMALALLAGLTPPDIEVSIVDELLQPIDFDAEVDLVGITVNTKSAHRAYAIAEKFRHRHIPVVLGGIHPNVARDEASQYADALVLGEAEGNWERVLADFGNGSLKKYYYLERVPRLENCPIPRRDLLQKNRYDTINLVQTSRGCPYKCNFCSVASLYGVGVRVRPVDDVIAEIKTLAGDDIIFVDDNLIGKTKYVKELLTRLAPLKKKWIGQAAVTVAYQKEVLKLLKKSGCAGLFVGFETNSRSSLKEVRKTQNINRDYFEAVKRLHDHGIAILGSFIVGFETDAKSCFESLLEFVVKSKIDVVDVTVMTPYPGTVLYERMKAENRLIDVHWWHKYDASDVVFKPKRMTRVELYEGRVWLLKELHKLDRLLKRWAGGLGRRSLFGNYISLKANLGFRKNANAIPRKAIEFPIENDDFILDKGI